MWKDAGNSMEQLFSNFGSYTDFPAVCPICREKNAHIYMHLYNAATRRGGLWIWCSGCLSFFHASVHVPAYWSNCHTVKTDKLTALPIYLDNLKDTLDEHSNMILHRIKQQYNNDE